MMNDQNFSLEKHIAIWVYYTYRDHKVLPKCIQKDLERSMVILGITNEKENDLVNLWIEKSNEVMK